MAVSAKLIVCNLLCKAGCNTFISSRQIDSDFIWRSIKSEKSTSCIKSTREQIQYASSESSNDDSIEDVYIDTGEGEGIDMGNEMDNSVIDRGDCGDALLSATVCITTTANITMEENIDTIDVIDENGVEGYAAGKDINENLSSP